MPIIIISNRKVRKKLRQQEIQGSPQLHTAKCDEAPTRTSSSDMLKMFRMDSSSQNDCISNKASLLVHS